MVDRIFKTILLFTPIAYCVGVNYYRFELIFFQIASIILFTSSLFDTPKREFNLKKLIGLFLGICLFSIAVNNFQTRSLSALINVFLACVDIYILAVYSQNLKKCLNWLLIGLGINTLIFIGQNLGYSPFIDPKTIVGVRGKVIITNQNGGIIGNAPRFAAFIALTLPFVKRIYLIPALIIGIFLRETAVFVSIFTIFVYESIKRVTPKQVWFFLFFPLIPIITVSFFHKSIWQSFNLRFEVWGNIINIFAQRAHYGFGLGNFTIADYAYSSFLQWIFGVGIIGIGFIYLCLKRMKWYLVPLLFLCIFEYPFEIPRLYPLLIFTIAYYAIEQKEERLC